MREFGLAVAIAQEAVMTNPLEAKRQDMQEEATEEFLGRQGHQLALAVVAIVAPVERDLVVFQLDQAVI